MNTSLSDSSQVPVSSKELGKVDFAEQPTVIKQFDSTLSPSMAGRSSGATPPSSPLLERQTEVFDYSSDDEMVKAFAMALLPEELKLTGFEGWDTKRGLDFAANMAENFKNLGILTGEEESAVDECKKVLDSVKQNAAFFQEGGRISSQYEEHFQKVKDNSRRYSYSGVSCSQVAESWLAASDSALKEIIDQLKNDGDRVYLPAGWLSRTGGHCAYIILEKKGNAIYAHEINAGAGSNIGEASSKVSAYSVRGNPGRTIKFCASPEGIKDVAKLIIEIADLQLPDKGLLHPKSEEPEQTYKWLFYYPGIPAPDQSETSQLQREWPKFTEYSQRSGNCVIKSTDILSRTILQQALAKKLGKDVNDPGLVKQANQLYRLYAIHSRVQLIKNFLEWHQDPANASKVDGDTLDMLRR
ncbi:MAG: hypothetical protein LBJ94_01770, partial [Puniceicoccales bacterium]|nr:hypothetical protein [Puniceicoccales bacterium]